MSLPQNTDYHCLLTFGDYFGNPSDIYIFMYIGYIYIYMGGILKHLIYFTILKGLEWTEWVGDCGQVCVVRMGG